MFEDIAAPISGSAENIDNVAIYVARPALSVSADNPLLIVWQMSSDPGAHNSPRSHRSRPFR
jgi:hypothetical protein